MWNYGNAAARRWDGATITAEQIVTLTPLLYLGVDDRQLGTRIGNLAKVDGSQLSVDTLAKVAEVKIDLPTQGVGALFHTAIQWHRSLVPL